MKKNFLVLRQDANGEKYFEINRERGGLVDSKDHSDGKIFPRPGSSRCLVETIQSHFEENAKHQGPQSLVKEAREFAEELGFTLDLSFPHPKCRDNTGGADVSRDKISGCREPSSLTP